MAPADFYLDRARARLAAVERQLAQDPDSEELIMRQFYLTNGVECLVGLALIRQRALLLDAWERRN